MTEIGALGRTYEDGEVVVRQGDAGDCLFVVQEGELEVVREDAGKETLLRVAGKDELIGEMAIFDRVVRSATVRARGRARVLTLDKRNFLRRIDEDPSLAFRIVETMCRRVRELTDQLVETRKLLGAREGEEP
jgi:CRP/FNR family transcriptional regulator, cyclic AMP receptor protein